MKPYPSHPFFFIIPGCLALRLPGKVPGPILAEGLAEGDVEREIPGETAAERELRLDLAKRHDRTGTSSVLAVVGMLTDIDIVIQSRPQSPNGEGLSPYGGIMEVVRERVNSLVAGSDPNTHREPGPPNGIDHSAYRPLTERVGGVGEDKRVSAPHTSQRQLVSAYIPRSARQNDLKRPRSASVSNGGVSDKWRSPGSRRRGVGEVEPVVESDRDKVIESVGLDRGEAEAEAEDVGEWVPPPDVSALLNRALALDGVDCTARAIERGGTVDGASYASNQSPTGGQDTTDAKPLDRDIRLEYPARLNRTAVALITVGCLNAFLKLRTFF
ncbi:hypothetical protein KIPB_006902 [Kipferlia bialata]|uniref:Uncharacterized protein n=1 Tax=Kipferlia bialata TaxID=797122 RepID=A0A9K3CXQ6_9EUKA|nr:hypothetical protein KIPB_006902 [Kipferlia bialata]|eukprot:g6902.t1